MNKQNEKLWTIEDVAEFLQVKPSVVKYWIYSRDIPYIKIGKFYRFEKNDIEAWIEQCRHMSENTRKSDLLKLIK